MVSPRRLTTIAVTWENYRALKQLGKTGESFNDVIIKLLESVK